MDGVRTGLLAWLLVGACAREPTQLVVVIDSNLRRWIGNMKALPVGPDTVRVDVTPDYAIHGSAGALTPFEDCAPLELVIGPQGGAMIPFRLQVDGVADVPECLLVETRLSSGDATFEASGARVATHCGQSYLIYSVIPWDLQHFLCEAPDQVVLMIEVDVQGVGSAKARVLVDTPRDCNDEPDLP